MFKALVVDDDDAIRAMLAQFLERDGFSVLTAGSAAKGTAMLGEHVDIVITDLRMESPLAGFDVVRAAAQMAPRPVIVILTAFPVPNSEWRSAGADALFVKGANTFALPKQLKALLAGRAPVS
jgi:DNA-binding response OmpR family regulator